jgi:hypothetical protein
MITTPVCVTETAKGKTPKILHSKRAKKLNNQKTFRSLSNNEKTKNH